MDEQINQTKPNQTKMGKLGIDDLTPE